METEYIKNRIIEDRENCALLLGNGINNYSQIGCSWVGLLKKLYEEFLPDSHFEGVPHGMTYTEFFDTIEIAVLEKVKSTSFDEDKSLYSTRDFSNAQENFIKVQELAQRVSLKHPSIDFQDALNSFNLEYQKFKETGLENYVQIMAILGDKFGPVVNSKLIDRICRIMESWNFTEKHKRVADFALQYNIPILTTNYDKLLAQSVNAKLHDFSDKINRDDSFPISCCYTTIDSEDINKFAIWHTNGMLDYPKSILIGLSHYTHNLEKVRSLIFPPNKFHAEFYENIFYGNPIIDKSWINLIFSKDLYIFGLSLDTDELILRWLLLERAKLYALDPPLRKKGFYILVYNDYCKMTCGKFKFLRSVGFEIITMDSYASMYEAISL